RDSGVLRRRGGAGPADGGGRVAGAGALEGVARTVPAAATGRGTGRWRRGRGLRDLAGPAWLPGPPDRPDAAPRRAGDGGLDGPAGAPVRGVAGGRPSVAGGRCQCRRGAADGPALPPDRGGGPEQRP